MTYVDFTEKTARFLYHNTTNLSTFTSVPKNAAPQPTESHRITKQAPNCVLGVSRLPCNHFMPLKMASMRKILTKSLFERKKEEIHAIINNAVYPPASKQLQTKKAAPSFTDEAASLLQFRIILELLQQELQSLRPLLRVPRLLLLLVRVAPLQQP